MKDNPTVIMTTAHINQPGKINDARTAASSATSTTTSNQPPAIPNNTVPARDYSIENNCRGALLKFFDAHDPDNLKNPVIWMS